MTKRRSVVRFFTLTAALLLVGAASHSAEANGSKTELAVIVSSNTKLSDLSFYELKLMYKGGKVAQPGGGSLIPLNRGLGSSDRVGFDKTVLGMSPKEVSQYWIDRRIRGNSGAPKSVDAAEMAARVVARLEGAITYLPPNKVKGDVKVLAIDGKKPGDPDYPIKY